MDLTSLICVNLRGVYGFVSYVDAGHVLYNQLVTNVVCMICDVMLFPQTRPAGFRKVI